MKKSAIALAVAGTLVASAAQAETTFYGRLAASILYNDADFIIDRDAGTLTPTDGNWDVINSGSRWGVRGSQDLGNGLSAIYRLETAVNAPEYNGNSDGQTGRLAWVGLKGGFGAVKLGAQWSPYYNVAGRADIFNEAGWYTLYRGPFRINNAVLYETPDSLGNFTGEIALQLDGAAGEDALDAWGIGFNYDGGSWGGGLAYRSEEVTDTSQFVAAGSIDFAGASLALVYENVNGNAILADTNILYGTAQYKFGNNILKAGYGYSDPKNVGRSSEWAIGIQHNLNSRTRVWAEYGADSIKTQLAGIEVETKPSRFSLGLRHDF